VVSSKLKPGPKNFPNRSFWTSNTAHSKSKCAFSKFSASPWSVSKNSRRWFRQKILWISQIGYHTNTFAQEQLLVDIITTDTTRTPCMDTHTHTPPHTLSLFALACSLCVGVHSLCLLCGPAGRLDMLIAQQAPFGMELSGTMQVAIGDISTPTEVTVRFGWILI